MQGLKNLHDFYVLFILRNRVWQQQNEIEETAPRAGRVHNTDARAKASKLTCNVFC